MTRLRQLRMITVFLVTVLVLLTACAPANEDVTDPIPTSSLRWPATEFYEVPASIHDASMVWSAEPGVDLFSAEGALVRAAQESLFIGWMIGLDYTYIGFAASSDSDGGGGIYGDFENDTGRGPFVGTIYGRIQQVIPTDTGFDVLACVLSAGLDVRVNGMYSPSGFAGGEGGELRSRFIRTAEPTNVQVTSPPSSTTEADDVHWQAPVGSQFVGWEIDGFADINPTTAKKGRCVPWARSLYPDAPRVITRDAYVRETPPPVQPAYPGWPENQF